MPDIVSEDEMRRFVLAFNSAVKPVSFPSAELAAPSGPPAAAGPLVSPARGRGRPTHTKIVLLVVLALVTAIAIATVVYLRYRPKADGKPEPPDPVAKP
jgi:hypothetical protein